LGEGFDLLAKVAPALCIFVPTFVVNKMNVGKHMF